MTTLLFVPFALVVVLAVLLWLVSLPLGDASIVDIFWGVGFAAIVWASYALAEASSERAWVVSGMVSIWGIRLAVHLARRNLGHGEDYRYRSMRARYGDRFPLISLFIVFVFQAVLMWVISWPAIYVHAASAAAVPLGWLDLLGVVVWATGLVVEWTADVQLARFKRRPDSRAAVMDRGLWRYSRHPNYFGNFLLWWGIGAIALSAGGWWTLAGPVLLTFLLLRVSGVALLESTISERRPAYRDYVRRTSAFVPWFPKLDPPARV